MARLVTLPAPWHVKITHVTYKMEHVWSVNMDYMVVIVMYHVPPTVMTTRVTDRMEHALHVDQDGLAHTVKQVILLSMHAIKI